MTDAVDAPRAAPGTQARRWGRDVSLVFFVNGALIATWAPHVPAVRERLELGEGQLGVAFLAMAIGSVLCMVASGPASARFGAHRITQISTYFLVGALLLPVLAPSYPMLIVALALLGGGIGTMDVSMNAVAADVEVRAARPIMSGFHALFSVGAIVGSVAAAGAIRLGISPIVHVAFTAVVLGLLVARAVFALPASPTRAADAGPAVQLPGRHVIAVGIIAMACFIAEGSVYDWGATLLKNDFGGPAAVAGLAYGAFSLTMAAVRFIGDTAKDRWGPVVLVRLGGIIAVAGLVLTITSHNAWVGLAGFAIMGIGLGNVVPIAFSAAASRGRTSADGIAGAATMGYMGFLAGPVAIGAVAEATSLPSALFVVVGLAVVIALGAGVVRRAA